MNLISKKDLLAMTGISYGQLYRWKRERLIPEEWFIKQSSYTGQETFFPREQILSRVKSIQDMKDEYSLEALAKIFSPEANKETVSIADLIETGILDAEIAEAILEVNGSAELDLWDAAFASALWKTFQENGILQEKALGLLQNSARAAAKAKSADAVCTVFLAEEEYHTVFTSKTIPLVFDNSIDVVCRIALGEAAEDLKLKYKRLK